MAEMSYLKKVGIAIDQLINAICGGYPDNTLSSRAYMWHLHGVRSWPMHVLDTVFFWDKNHCEASYASERNDRHLPPELRD